MPKKIWNPKNRLRLEKLLILIVLLIPLLALGIDALQNNLGANPVETLTHKTGLWALRILLLSLLLTPIRIVFKWKRAMLYRRLLGLLAFFYAALHFLVYLVFDQELDFSDTLADIVKRPYITVGFAALVIMIPLAVTSTNKMLKRMGAKNWNRLHKLVYLAAILVILHYLWLVKKDLTDPLIYGAFLAVLLAVRIYEAFKKRARSL